VDVRMALNVNGKLRRVTAPADAFLIDVLRDQLDLTGAKNGCGMGECGACTVLLDGAAIFSCLTLAIEVQGHEITTIEGLSRGGDTDPVQRAFAETGGVQCGFCTPGMILSASALLAETPRPTEDEVRRALSGNLCRCTGYGKIVEAVLAATKG
jgi:aerobic-type carbon monoxide dehydrogenase small subunit (CoxS/CutS family)